jgi:hypothetical protein
MRHETKNENQKNFFFYARTYDGAAEFHTYERMYTNTPMTYMMNLLKINQVQKSLLFFHFFLDFCKLAAIYLQPKFKTT